MYLNFKLDEKYIRPTNKNIVFNKVESQSKEDIFTSCPLTTHSLPGRRIHPHPIINLFF
jgi:hypothetical protein